MADIPVKNPATDKPDMASGKVENAYLARIVAEAVAEALKIAIPAAAVGINAAQSQALSKSQEVLYREVQRKTKRCPICALPESACGGAFAKDSDGNEVATTNPDGTPLYMPQINHIKWYCGPSDHSLFKWFQGVIIKGVRFLSDYPGHSIWIPRKSDIPTIINNWERNEKELSQKREAYGNGAGHIDANGNVVNKGSQNAIGWR